MEKCARMDIWTDRWSREYIGLQCNYMPLILLQHKCEHQFNIWYKFLQMKLIHWQHYCFTLQLEFKFTHLAHWRGSRKAYTSALHLISMQKYKHSLRIYTLPCYTTEERDTCVCTINALWFTVSFVSYPLGSPYFIFFLFFGAYRYIQKETMCSVCKLLCASASPGNTQERKLNI